MAGESISLIRGEVTRMSSRPPWGCPRCGAESGRPCKSNSNTNPHLPQMHIARWEVRPQEGELTPDERLILKASELLRDAAIEGCVSHVKALMESRDGRSWVLEIDNSYTQDNELQVELTEWEGP